MKLVLVSKELAVLFQNVISTTECYPMKCIPNLKKMEKTLVQGKRTKMAWFFCEDCIWLIVGHYVLDIM